MDAESWRTLAETLLGETAAKVTSAPAVSFDERNLVNLFRAGLRWFHLRRQSPPLYDRIIGERQLRDGKWWTVYDFEDDE